MRPTGGDPTARLGDIYLGYTDLRLGSTNREGVKADDAWQDFGFDLDGLCTNSSTCSGVEMLGCRSGGPSIPYDGLLCRDNTFARLQPVIAAVPELGEHFGLGEAAFNCELWRGGWNEIVRISGYSGMPDDPRVRVDYYSSPGVQHEPAWKCPEEDYKDKYPRWLSSAAWGVTDSTLTGPIGAPGTLPDSKFADADAYVRNGYLVAHKPDDAEQGFLGDRTSYHGFKFKSQKTLFVGRLVKAQDGTWTLQDGLTGGRIRKTDLVQSFRDIGFCEKGNLSTFYDRMLTYVNENSDVLASGENDPAMQCDAMSYAFGFHAAQLTPGTAVKMPPLIECCGPGRTEEQCTAMCGDGKVSGDEKCDTKIPAGMPGACPTTCAPTDSCTPQQVMGTECAITCVPMPITLAGAADGCCPTGANATTDRDCKPSCGNGVVETGETCDPKESCKACQTTNACAPLRATGSADTCNLRCEPEAITQCRNGDNCCPAGCGTNNDRDCSSSCGNGRVDTGETCEKSGAMPCAANCDDGKSCTVDRSTGSAANCNLVCVHAEITEAKGGDGCCPPGASANNDSDCQAACGNKVIEGNEQCDDGNDAAGDGCVRCQKETQQQTCLVKLGTDDACAQCTCNKCANQGIACYGAADSNDIKLCKDMVDCGRSSGCGDPDCYCGSSDIFLCLAGVADGPCMNQVAAAAKTNALLDILSRSADTGFPLGRANALGDCVDMNCASECGR